MKNLDFTRGKIVAPLLEFAVPVLLALFLQAMYGGVDLFIVGQFASSADVSAVSTGSQIMQTITGVIVGIAVGTTVLLGQRIGEGNSEKAGDVVGASICLFIAIGVVLTLVMTLCASPFARLMQAPEEAFEQTVSYVRICSLGAVFIIAYNVLGSIFRGMGNSKIPLITVLIACVFNIVGDYVLVAKLGMGASGAALATVAAQAISVLISALVIRRQPLPFAFSKKNVRFDMDTIKGVVKLGAPIALQDALVSASFLVILAIVNSLGLIASAGVGVAEKVCAFIMLMPSAFSQAISAFVAQNIGAGEPQRAKKALFTGIGISLACAAFIFYVSFFHGDALCSIFAKDADVIAAGADYLRAYAIDTIFVSIMFCMSGYFNGCGKTLFVMLQGIAGAFLVRIPVSFIMSRSANVTLFKVGLATPCSTVLQIILFVTYYIVLSRKEKTGIIS